MPKCSFLPAIASGVATLVALSSASAQVYSDNTATVDQRGVDNSVFVDQLGHSNWAGTANNPLEQDGYWNELEIRQSGNGNRVGLPPGGLHQLGRHLTPSIHNLIVIEQLSDNNVVRRVRQEALGPVPNGANDLIIRQLGGTGNVVDTARQIQQAGEARQLARIRQEGENNRVRRVAQYANSLADAAPNRIRLDILGSRNGRLGLSGSAARAAVWDGGIVQERGTEDRNANGNMADLAILGDDTRFGIRQGGRLNTTGALTITGDRNELGVRQDGTSNTLALAVIEGDDNRIGVDQLDTNIADITLLGTSNGNDVLAMQQGTNRLMIVLAGTDNTVSLRQDVLRGLGGDNHATVTVKGSMNAVALEQSGRNRAGLIVSGDANRVIGPSLASDTASLQEGEDNVLEGEISGQSNDFAGAQVGRENVATLRVSGGSNFALILQHGEENAARVEQMGLHNSVRVRQ